MEDLKYEYIDGENDNKTGSDQKGYKGCIAKLATKVKREVVKTINRKALKTHGVIIVAGTAPMIIGQYPNGKPKYKKRKNTSDFNFDETRHTATKSKVSEQSELLRCTLEYTNIYTVPFNAFIARMKNQQLKRELDTHRVTRSPFPPSQRQ